ncbi:MAG: glycosyltransferase [Candidatus Electrothrix sp. AR5]|nr:glycosyltransferase [Candidatus Electrothrix sp. AR5]
MLTSVVLGTYNRKRYLKKTITNVREELRRLQGPGEIIVVDGGSTDGTITWLTKQKDIILILQHNRGEWKGESVEKRSWGYFMNLAFKCAQGKYVCMISDDSLLIPGSLKNGVEDFEEMLQQGKSVGALAFYWRNWPTYDRYFVIKVKGKTYLNHGIYLNKALKDVNYINEQDYYFYCADTDLSFRLNKAGYTVETTVRSLVEHSQHINKKVRQSNKGDQKKRLHHDERALQKNWSDFFGDDDYCDVVTYELYEDLIPDNTIAEDGFGYAYKVEYLRSKMNYWFSEIPRQVFFKITKY